MRCYHFCNMYLAGVHAGIQSAHAQHELAVKYLKPMHEREAEWETIEAWTRDRDAQDRGAEQYLEWAENHKTMILLNAGMMGDLLKLETILSSEDNTFPFATFREDEYALNKALTNVCVVLPYQMYELSYHIMQFDKEPWPGFYQFKHDGNERALVRLEDGTVELRANTDVLYVYDAFKIDLIKRMSAMKLM